MVSDLPVVDNRQPGFASMPSFGMVGPTRIVVFAAELPALVSDLAGGMVLGYKTEGTGSPPWFVQYKGVFDLIEVSVFVSWLFPSSGTWRVGVDVNSGNPGLRGTASRSVFNFTWQFPPLVVFEETGPYGDWSIHKVAEWHQITRRFPSATFPDEV